MNSEKVPVVCAKRTLARLMCRILPGFPFLAEAADGFAQAHSERGDSFETLLRALWELSVALATDFGEEKFRVSEDAGERIVEFVAEHFAEVFFVERAWRVRNFLRFGGLGIGYRWPRQIGFLQTSFDEVESKLQTTGRADNEIRQSGGHERGHFSLALCITNDDNGRVKN